MTTHTFYATPIARESGHQVNDFSGWLASDESREFLDTAHALCASKAVSVSSVVPVSGIWREFRHPAFAFTVEGDLSDVRAVCSRLASRYEQDSIMLVTEGDTHTMCSFEGIMEFPESVSSGMLAPYLVIAGNPSELASLVGTQPSGVRRCAVEFLEPKLPHSKTRRPVRWVQQMRETYRRDRGYDYSAFFGLTDAESRREAEYYDIMEHDAQHPAVQESYRFLLQDLCDQYRIALDNGFTCTPFLGGGEPYSSSRDMMRDISKKKLMFLRTEVTNTSSSALPVDHPMSHTTVVNGVEMSNNDIFRVVHDVWAHGDGHSFSPEGEARAWWTHRNCIDPRGWMALWCETRGQNVWTNFGPQAVPGSPLRERPFAPQKAGVVPTEFV